MSIIFDDLHQSRPTSLILIKKSEIRHSKINSLLSNVYQKFDIPHIELPQDVILFPHLTKKCVIKHFGPDINFVYVEKFDVFAPYHYAASLNKTVSVDNPESIHGHGFIKQGDMSRGYISLIDSFHINSVLSEYGIKKKDDMDEFNSIHLGEILKK
jgi:hypothetical protein